MRVEFDLIISREQRVREKGATSVDLDLICMYILGYSGESVGGVLLKKYRFFMA